MPKQTPKKGPAKPAAKKQIANKSDDTRRKPSKQEKPLYQSRSPFLLFDINIITHLFRLFDPVHTINSFCGSGTFQRHTQV
ncbi:predicted protein [Lichtheimia corymbifera JMRC:FSU:9682]|uniref:Uncharacterized protein n=1 Tax=Lichtheimia corymbifera JMRC:FSU:9682 TaxID=1263082 RepID=A0A068RFH4_9FUNG|nr:predicted protein [Lichtheimia corymbifera JMRC:FSU:9682]